MPHLILLDMMLPDQSGLDVCKILKSQPETEAIPIVFVTGQSESDLIVDAFAAGGCDYVTKPFRIDEVLARVTVHIQLLRTQHELAAKNAQLKFLASQLVDLNVQLGHDARLDSLTTLLNRRAWTESANLEHERSVRHAHNFCIIMIDVDHFKLFNDTFGHPAGDDCLKQVGSAILRASREIDLIGRYGGEEFVVMAPETDREGAMQLAERIRQTVLELAIPHPSAPSGDRITVSLGVATHETSTLEHVILRADRALYRSKEQGKATIT